MYFEAVCGQIDMPHIREIFSVLFNAAISQNVLYFFYAKISIGILYC